jgi:hypothetical protein
VPGLGEEADDFGELRALDPHGGSLAQFRLLEGG